MRRDPRAELHGEHLRAEANSQKRPLLPQRHRNPVDFPADEFIGVVGAHRPAENDRAGMVIQGFRQGIAEARTPDIQPVTERPQRIADPARRRGLLVQDDQHRQQGFGSRRRGRGRCGSTGEAQDVFAIDFARLKHRLFLFGGHQARIIPKSPLISGEFTGNISKSRAKPARDGAFQRFSCKRPTAARINPRGKKPEQERHRS